MKIKSFCLAFCSALILSFAMACGGGAGGGDAEVGASCEGIGASEARIACSGNQIIFCSSYTDYVYTVQNECSEGQTCSVAEDGRSASCQ